MSELTELDKTSRIKNKKVEKIAAIALLFSFVAIAGASGIQYLENIYCMNCTLDNPTIVNYTFPGGGNGTSNHAELTNLEWSAAGHIIDTSIDMDGYSLDNVGAVYNILGFTLGTDGTALNIEPDEITLYGPTSILSTVGSYTSSISALDNLVELVVVDDSIPQSAGIYVNSVSVQQHVNGSIVSEMNADGVYYPYLDNSINSHVCASGDGFLNIDCVGDNLKVNKSGDTMTGMLNASGGIIATNFTLGASIPISLGVVAGTLSRAGDIVISRSTTDRLLIGSGAFGSSTYVVVGAENLFYPVQKPTASAPTYHLGAMYFDTTLNKLRIGGAAGWETVTSI